MKKNKRLLKMILSIAVIVILSAAGIFYHIGEIQESLWNQTVSEILEVTSQGGHAFEVYIEKDLQILTRVAKVLSQRVSDDELMIESTMDIFADEDICFTVVDLTNGVLYPGCGITSEKLEEERIKAYEAVPESGLLEPYVDEYTGQRMV
ncbi:MAG: hypothetical protein K2P23_13905, partial [Lachnospiraceae bacterium]|nr:hypothetical protein [Lachnospiraceae bacterium]